MYVLSLLFVTLFSSINHALLARRNICHHKKGNFKKHSICQFCQHCIGLPCYTKEILMPGSSYTIASKTCDNGKYMKNENCVWYFDVKGCKPSIQCNGLDIRGRGKKK